jgi:hypothetical protein
MNDFVYVPDANNIHIRLADRNEFDLIPAEAEQDVCDFTGRHLLVKKLRMVGSTSSCSIVVRHFLV